MARDKDVKNMIKRVNKAIDGIDEMLKKQGISIPNHVDIAKVDPEVEKDRVAYKEGLVDGICMYSWRKDDDDNTDYVGSPTSNMELKDVLEEIGSVFGFDGKEQYERVKMVEKVETANRKVDILNNEVKNGDVKITDIDGKEIDGKDDMEEVESKL